MTIEIVHVIWKECLENLTHTGDNEGERESNAANIFVKMKENGLEGMV